MQTPASPEKRAETCRRCGECCRKGGPAFHLADRLLIEKGLVPAACLYTIRPGEPVRDNVAGGLTFAKTDIIKIKGSGGGWTCHFLADDGQGCRIYAERPEECRQMQCWDLLGGVEGLWELISHHEERCAYRRLHELAPRLATHPETREETKNAICEMVRYDESLRALIVERGQARADMLDFLLGRPLARTLPGFHIGVERKNDALRLVYSPLT